MDVTVYLPDELGQRAKAARFKLSRMLRAAIQEELETMATKQRTLESAEEIVLDLVDEEERPYKGRFVGTEIAEDVYLADDDRVLFHDRDKLRYYVVDDPGEELRNLCHSDTDYFEAMNALGLEATIDI